MFPSINLFSLFFIIISYSLFQLTLSAQKSHEYLITINIPEHPSIFIDTIIKYNFSDCPMTMLIKADANQKDKWSDASQNIKHYFLLKKLNDSTNTNKDTINMHLCLGNLKEEFFKKLNGDYLLRCEPENDIFKSFETKININSAKDRGRFLFVKLGNYAAKYTYRIICNSTLSKNEIKSIRHFYLDNIIDRERNFSLPAPTRPLDKEYIFMYSKKCSIQLLDRKIENIK